MLNSVSDHQIERPALVSLIAPTLPLAGQVIVVSGDWLYVQRFFADLAASVMDFAKGWSLLLVVFDATPACVEEFLQKHGVHEFVSVVYAEARPQNLDIRQLIFSREPAYLRMLCVNQYVDRFFKRQLVKLGIRLSLNWECLFSKEALDRRESQTVYASARFVLPAKFFQSVAAYYWLTWTAFSLRTLLIGSASRISQALCLVVTVGLDTWQGLFVADSNGSA